MPWIDHLRTFVIFLVVIQHACVTYSHVGSWYILSKNEPSFGTKVLFVLWQGHAQSFFMGLLFFISGYFAELSLTRKGTAAYLRERWSRLGLPTLFFMLVITPFIIMVLKPWYEPVDSIAAFYQRYILSGRFVGSTGPMWFAFALFIFSVVFAVWRVVVKPKSASVLSSPLTLFKLSMLGIALVIATFVTRLWFPLGSSVINFQLGYFPQYILAFILGIFAARQQWLPLFAASRIAKRAGLIAIVAGPIALIAVVYLNRSLGDSLSEALGGGLHWPAFELAAWEQLTGLGIALGLLALFSSRFNIESRTLRWLSDRSFGVYLLHTPVLIAFTLWFRPLEASVNPLALAALLSVVGLLVGFGIADVARRVPGLRAIV